MSDVLDLTSIRGKGLQAGEVELPDGDGPPEPGMATMSSSNSRHCNVTPTVLISLYFLHLHVF